MFASILAGRFIGNSNKSDALSIKRTVENLSIINGENILCLYLSTRRTRIFRNALRAARKNRKTRAHPRREKFYNRSAAQVKLRNDVITGGGGIVRRGRASGNLGIAPVISISRVASVRPRAYGNKARLTIRRRGNYTRD